MAGSEAFHTYVCGTILSNALCSKNPVRRLTEVICLRGRHVFHDSRLS